MNGVTCSVVFAAALVLGGQHRSLTVAVPVEPPDFTGEWVLDVERSDFGMSPRADSSVTTISRADERLILSRITSAGMGQHGQIELDMPIDGEIHEGTGLGGTPVPASARWEGDALVLTVFGQSNVGDIEIVDVMTLEDDVLRVERTVVVPGMAGLTQSLVLRRRS
jgi:hypothetical protein